MTKIQTQVQRPPPFLSAFLWPKAATPTCWCLSSSRSELSLEHAPVRPTSALPPTAPFLCWDWGALPDSCSRSCKDSGHWAPASKADCVLRAGKCFWPMHLCAALRVREWEQFGTHGVWHGATVSCGPTNVRGASHVSLLQGVQAGQSKSCEQSPACARVWSSPTGWGKGNAKRAESFLCPLF